MTITLTAEQEAWLKAHVASGDFASVEEAARQLIDERIAERAAEEGDDLAWAKPYVDDARAAVARGDVVTLDEHKSRNAARLCGPQAEVTRVIVTSPADADTADIVSYLAAKARYNVAATYIAAVEKLDASLGRSS